MAKQFGGLGRGLGSLIPQMTPVRDAVPKEQPPLIEGVVEEGLRLIHVSPSQIVPNPRQPRRDFAPEELNDLADSIREHGVLQPLTVTDKGNGQYELIAGERRLRASTMAGLEKVPVVIREATDREKLELAIIENVQRSDLNPVEEALAYKALMEDFGLTQDDMAARVGKSRPFITNALRLLDLPDDIIDAIKDGRISKSAGRTLLAEGNVARQRDLFERMLKGGVSIREAERVVRAHVRQTNLFRDPNLEAIERELREKIGTKVEIKMTAAATGQVIIHFYSKDDLKALVEHLS
jgi:ParB family chromosome partitioning protein